MVKLGTVKIDNNGDKWQYVENDKKKDWIPYNTSYPYKGIYKSIKDEKKKSSNNN